MKTFYVQECIGRRYIVSYHTGEKKHSDGSPFYDIRIFKSRKSLNVFVKELQEKGYTKQ